MENLDQDTPQVSEEEIDLLKDIFKNFIKTVKTLNVYPKQNPIAQKFISELSAKFSGFLETYGDIRLKVEQFGLLYKGKEVFYSEERSDNFALYLFIDGIREFSFSRGLEAGELEALVDILMTVPKQENPEDDIVTLLWEKELEHIDYFVPEDVTEDDDSLEEEFLFDPGTESQQVQGATYSDLTIIPAGLDVELSPFSDNELKEIKNELSVMESNSLLLFTSGMLIDLMGEETDLSGFGLYVKGLSIILEIWVERKNPEAVLDLLRRLEAVEFKPGSDDEQKESLKRIYEKVSEYNTIKWLLEGLKDQSLGEFIKIISTYALDSLVWVLGDSEDRRMRKTLCIALAGLARENPLAFGRHIADERWYLIRNIVHILGLSRNREAVPLIEKALKNPESRVRRECVKSLDSIGTEEVKKPLFLLLDDQDSLTRTAALKALKRVAASELLIRISEAVKKEDFKGKPFSEKREFLEAFGALGKEEALPLLLEFYKKKRFLFRRDESLELRAAAAYGLAHVPDEKARELLKKGAESKKSLLREACIASLRCSVQKKP